MEKVRETMRKSVVQYIGYRSFCEDCPNSSINRDWKQQYIRGVLEGMIFISKESGFLERPFLPLNFHNLCCQRDRFRINFLKVIFMFRSPFFTYRKTYVM